ncbi:hypothetical protein [Nostoc sp. ChiSLP03a]|uniref:hypothetical protein n=1 Tax=Nostoc sp. ChiSLP03a TaxID=3075380 RepID=UPI002AD48861|nr:hypothetical protein [Nostoc sp. ChiSLP03a]MDZ8214048.1 hypothetical protein [Nostoc sp. ChiSLP03a]
MIDPTIVSKEFNKLINSTEDEYFNILNEVLPFIISSLPCGEKALKICESLSRFQNAEIKAFLLETGNQDIRTAIKIITDDLNEKNFEYELIQALTLLKRGRDTFLSLIDKEYSSWGLFRMIPKIRDNYTRAFIASNFIAFCYRLLNDDTKSNKAFDESQLYFYYRLYHYSERATEKIKGDTIKPAEFVIEGKPIIVNVGASLREREQAEEAVVSYYMMIQAEEENFIKMSKAIFGKNLAKKLGNNPFKTETERKGGKTLGGVYGKLYTLWEPPITNKGLLKK